jgi:hypothetical protein
MQEDTRTDETEKATEVAGQNKRLVMPRVAGYVTYDVAVNCPHCKKRLQLNQTPYVDSEDDEYELAEDYLGAELFGSTTKPAKWKDFEIEYKCCGCEKEFILNAIEI